MDAIKRLRLPLLCFHTALLPALCLTGFTASAKPINQATVVSSEFTSLSASLSTNRVSTEHRLETFGLLVDDGHDHQAVGGDNLDESLAVLGESDIDVISSKIDELTKSVDRRSDFEIKEQNRKDRIEELTRSLSLETSIQPRHLLAVKPVLGATVTSPYGYRTIFGKSQFHKGIDLALPTGSPVYATGEGTVTYAGWVNGYGNYVKIQHADGYETRYAHNSKLLVSTGDRVRQGQEISQVGCTGRCTGPHLHYEVRLNGEPKNPQVFLAMAE